MSLFSRADRPRSKVVSFVYNTDNVPEKNWRVVLPVEIIATLQKHDSVL